MANSNFVVHNGLTVGPLTIDAATGSISTSGTVTVTGGLAVSTISKNDSSMTINDTGTGSSVVIVIDGTTEHTIDANGVNLASGDIYAINGTSVLSSTALGSGVLASSLTSVGTLTSLAVSGVSTLGGNIVIAGSDTTSTTTGALVLTGTSGASIGGNAYVGNNLYIGSTALSQQANFANPTIIAVDSGSNYAQIALKNTNSSGSADFAAYADNGTDAGGWIDMGVAGTAYSDGNYTITKPQDGSLLVRPTSSTYGGNLVIGTSEAGSYNDVAISVGSFFANAEVARFHGNATTSGYLALKQGTASTSTTTGALVVTGGVGISGALNVGGATIHTGATTLSSALTYGGVTLTNAVTGTGKMVLDTSPTISAPTTTGTLSASAITASGTLSLTSGVDNNGTQYTSGALQINGGAGISGNLYVQGNVYAGNLISTTTQILEVTEPLVYLAASNPGTYNYEIGVYSHFVGGPLNNYQHTTVARDHNDATWKFASNIPEPSGGTISFTNAIWDKVKQGDTWIANTTTSSSTTTGALRVDGGAGIAGAVNIGGRTTTAGLTTSSTILASANNTLDIGAAGTTFATVYATTFSGVSTTAKYADLAENYQADKAYAPGTVVMFGGSAEVTVADADATAVAGVVSTNPAHLMNGGLTGVNVVPLALQGRVPCNVIGPVKKGDLMVSAGFGFAKTNNTPAVGTVIGKALNDFNGAKGQIEVVVGRV